MRRTRHVALPVRAWQYVGLLIVSLACLTLGLVSRDKEGRAGSLAGPEMEHRAPHEVDACPNLKPFTKSPACSNLRQDRTQHLIPSRKARSFESISPPTDLRNLRSRSLDRVSRVRSQSRVGLVGEERLPERRTSVDSSRRILESRLETRNQERSSRRSSDPTIRRYRSVDARLAARSLDRRSRSIERRLTLDQQRQNRQILARRMIERDSRIETHSNRRVDRENRLEIRERRFRSLERREPSLERREREKRENVREDRSAANRVAFENRANRRVENSRSPVRAVREDRLNSERNRLNVRSNSRERRSSVDRENRDRRSTEIRTNANARQFSRDSERATRDIVRVDGQTFSSLKRQNSRNSDRFADRRLSKRSTNVEGHREQSRLQSRVNEFSREREAIRRDRNDRARLHSTTKRDSRTILDRRSIERSERREPSNEPRERRNRLIRHLDARSNDRRDSSIVRLPLVRSKIENLERRERSIRSNPSSEPRQRTNRLVRHLDARSNDRRDSSIVRLAFERSRIENLERRERTIRSNPSSEPRQRTNRLVRHLDAKSNERRDSSIVRLAFERSRIENLERRERTIRLNPSSEPRQRTNRLVRHLDARSNDRRDSSTVRLALERSRIENLERRERTIRLNPSSEPRQRTNRLVRHLDARSNDRRDSSTVRLALERSRIENLERRERVARSNPARESRESRIRIFGTLESSRRDSEQRRARNLSNDRRSERRTLGDSIKPSTRRSIVLESLNREEVRAERRLVQRKFDQRDLDSRRSLRQRVDRLQRTRAAIPTNDLRSNLREHRLTDRTRVPVATSRSRTPNDVERSRSIDLDLVRFSGKQLDSRLPRVSKIYADSRFARVSGIQGILKEENFSKDSSTFEVVRQALVIGLCAMYGLSMFYEKRSFISNVVRQAPRFIVW